MKRFLVLLTALLFNVNAFAQDKNSVTQDIVHYLHTSSLSTIKPQLDNCQKDIATLNEKIDNVGFWKETALIDSLGRSSLTNVLKIEVIGDKLQLISDIVEQSSKKQKSTTFYDKSKQLLLDNDLILLSESTFKDSENRLRKMSTFKKVNYSLDTIRDNKDKLLSSHDIIAKQALTCLNNVLNSSTIEQLNKNEENTRTTLTNNFYKVYPQLKKDKVLEQIFTYQTYPDVYYSTYYREKISNDFVQHYSEDIKTVLSTIFNNSTIETKAFIKQDGVAREVTLLYKNFDIWEKQSREKIITITHHTYDSVNSDVY